MKVDVVVVGGGSAGIAAAVTVAREGFKVCLIERYGFAGGQATSALVGTICGLYHRDSKQARHIYDGFPAEFAERLQRVSATHPLCFDQGLWFLPYDRFAFRQIADEFLTESGVEILYHTTCTSIHFGEMTTVQILSPSGNHCIETVAVVDASGDAVVSKLCGLPLLAVEEAPQTAAVVFGLGGLPDVEARALHLNIGTVVHRACDQGRLPDFCRRISIVPGSMRQGNVLIKLGLPVGEKLEVLSRKVMRDILDLLHCEPVFKQVFISELPAQVGSRSHSRPKGQLMLTEADVLTPDTTTKGGIYGGWPIEFWSDEIRPLMQYLPEGAVYPIPTGCLRSSNEPSLFFAGRALSADEKAAASARVIGTCLATGEGAGYLAVAHVRKKRYAT